MNMVNDRVGIKGGRGNPSNIPTLANGEYTTLIYRECQKNYTLFDR